MLHEVLPELRGLQSLRSLPSVSEHELIKSKK